MLDNLLNSVRRGAGRVQRRGEEVAQTARLRLEVFQLTRELDGLYARLGRSYHGGADMGVLQGVREDIRRVDEEISVRERLMEELARNPDGAQDRPDATGNAAAEVPRMAYRVGPAATPVDVSASSEPTIPDATPRPDQAPPPEVPHIPAPAPQRSDETLVFGASSGGQEADAYQKEVKHEHELEEARSTRKHPDPSDH
jgi:hypothetical protein